MARQTATAAPRLEPTLIPTTPAQPTPTSQPAHATSSPPPAAQATPTTGLFGEAPIFQAPRIEGLDWSPDGRFLSWTSQQLEDVIASPVPQGEDEQPGPPGTFHILDTGTGEICEYIQPNDLGLNFTTWHRWLPGDRLAVRTLKGKLVLLSPACSGEISIPTASEQAQIEPVDLAAEGVALSPGSGLRAYTKEEEGKLVTSFTRVLGGQSLGEITWSLPGGILPGGPGGSWLSEDRFLIPRSTRGPLLVLVSSVGQGASPQVVEVGPHLFNVPADPEATAVGASQANASNFHIALSGEDSLGQQTWLYHSEADQVEKLLFHSVQFSPQGSLLQAESTNGGLWLRPVDPPGAPTVRLAGSEELIPPAWDPSWERAALASDPRTGGPATLTIRQSPEGSLLAAWRMPGVYGFYNYHHLVWSRGGRYLAAAGADMNNANQQALFLFQMPEE